MTTNRTAVHKNGGDSPPVPPKVVDETILFELAGLELHPQTKGFVPVFPLFNELEKTRSDLMDLLRFSITSGESSMGLRSKPANRFNATSLLDSCHQLWIRCDDVIANEVITCPLDIQYRMLVNQLQTRVGDFIVRLAEQSSSGMISHDASRGLYPYAKVLREDVVHTSCIAAAVMMGVNVEMN